MTDSDMRAYYREKRRRAQAEADMRRLEAIRAVPELEALLTGRSELCYSMGERLRNAGDAASEEAKTAAGLTAIDAEICEALKSGGFSPDWLDVKYDCHICRDTGYTSGPVRKPCVCAAVLSGEGCGLIPGETFERFDIGRFPEGRQRDGMAAIRAMSESMADGFPDCKTGLLFTGPSGLGKTYLLCCIGERVKQRGHSVRRMTAYDYISGVMESIRQSIPEPDVMSPELLILDDLGAEPLLSNITVERIGHLIDERMTLRRHTAIATNLTFEDLGRRYGERITSRLFDRQNCNVIRLSGDDIRLRK